MTTILTDAVKTFETVDDMAEDSFEKDNNGTLDKLKGFDPTYLAGMTLDMVHDGGGLDERGIV